MLRLRSFRNIEWYFELQQAHIRWKIFDYINNEFMLVLLGETVHLLEEVLEVLRINARGNTYHQLVMRLYSSGSYAEEHTVPKVANPSLVVHPEPINHLLHRLRDALLGTIQTSRISIALEDNLAVSSNLDGLLRVVKPVHADDVVAEVAGSVEGVPGALGEDSHGYALETHALELLGELLGDVGEVGLGELAEGGGAQLSSPGVEDHDEL